jgi:antitoxin CptB
MSVQSRLRWRCRRGTRELDAVLGEWLETRFTAAGDALREDFEALLDCADPDLWNWLTGHAEPAARFAAIIADIRTSRVSARSIGVE